MATELAVNHLTVQRDGRDVVRDCSFVVAPGELVAVTGENGAGKSTLLAAIMGYPECAVVGGDIALGDDVITALPLHERARRGVFLVHQEPPAIPGVSIAGAIRAAAEAVRGSISIPAVQGEIREACARLGIDETFSRRPLNDGLSGGEKKRAELLQMLVAHPAFVLVDELDSGLDAGMIDVVVRLIAELRQEGVGFVVVSHSSSFIELLRPTRSFALAKA